jgi:LPXTG-site transpeptidase (sortase) family protein
MNNDKIIKNYPAATPEAAKLLNLNGEHLNVAPASVAGIPGLPVASDDESTVKETSVATHTVEHSTTTHSTETQLEDVVKTDRGQALKKVAKAAAPYLMVFIVGIFLYYFFFTGINFSGIFKNQTSAPQTSKETAMQQLEKANMAAYQKWIAGFYYDVSDAKVLDPEADNSGNGLSNFQKYLLNLNPKSYDSLGNGIPDSQALAGGINPLSGGSITDKQKDILSKYVDMEVVMNRLTLSNMQNPGRVAGSNTNSGGTPLIPIPTSGSGGVNNNPTSVPLTSPTTGADLMSEIAANVNMNQNIAGRLEIPSLKINVPIIWTKDPKNFDKDLQTGVVHYPGTAVPGQIGTTYISGHSSNYAWAKGDYNKVFSKLGDLADDTSFKITVVDKNGRDVIFHYVVTGRKEYKATDQEQFKNTGKSQVALSTCWPVGSTAKRLVVWGTLTQVEK